MTKFEGFPSQFNYASIPHPFFKDILLEIDDLNELIISIYYFWRIDQMEGDFRYLRKSELLGDSRLVEKIGEEELDIGLEKAVERGTFLMAEVELDNKIVELYFVNTVRGQNAVKKVQQGLWSPSGDPGYPITLDMDRPNIFQLYEENIGALTPLIADSLKETEKLYPPEWIIEAITKSVENNARSWRYVLAILERWQEEGKNVQTKENKRSSEKDRKKYTEW